MRILLLAVGLAPFLVGEIPQSTYQSRRQEIRKKLNDGVTVLYGRLEHDDLRSGFFQAPNVYSLTGWLEPGAILLLDPDREILFVPKKNPDAERWTGPKGSPQDADIQARSGFPQVMAAEHLERELRKSLEQHGARIYALPNAPQTAKLQAVSPLAEVKDPRIPIARLRMKKTPEEIALIQHTTDVTLAGHRAAWKKTASGVHEYQVAASMSHVFLENGCERHAYAPIVGSGFNSTVLHYSRNARRMDSGELLLMDVGAECAGYAADVTRTIPVSGKFTPRQKEIYEIVLGAQKAVIDAIKPGVRMGSRTSPAGLQKIAFDYINTHGKDKKGEPLGKYFIHGLGHHVGLEVHDAFDPALELQAGMIVTVEPGIYIPEENLGVRIEDMVLVTENGAKVLSGALPREVGDLEKALAR